MVEINAGGGVTIRDDVAAYLARLRTMVQGFDGYAVHVGSTAPYAIKIETGWGLHGDLGRRAGGIFYLGRAFDSVVPDLPRQMGLLVGQGMTAQQALNTIAVGMADLAKINTQEVTDTGALQSSVQATYPGHEAVPFTHMQPTRRGNLARRRFTEGQRVARPRGAVGPGRAYSTGLSMAMMPRTR